MPIEPMDLVQDTLRRLAGMLPGTDLTLTGGPEAHSIDLPYAVGADYRFQLWFYPDGERGITAQLIPSGATAGRPPFWFWAFELPDFRQSPIDLAHAFDEQVRLLLAAPTRVREHRGWLFTSFSLECQSGEEWRPVRGCSFLRFGLGGDGADQVYHAGTVADSHERA